jgi:hypothetical protein
MGIGIRRIRSFIPQVLAVPEQGVEETPAVPQPKKPQCVFHRIRSGIPFRPVHGLQSGVVTDSSLGRSPIPF